MKKKSGVGTTNLLHYK